MRKNLSKNTHAPSLFFYLTDKQGKEKFVLGPISKGKHLTIHLGRNSKTFDIHITDETNNSYETILAIRYFSAYRLWLLIRNDIAKLVYETYSHHINLGKLKKYNCILQPLILNENTSKIFKSNKENTRFRISKTININDLTNLFIDLNNVDINCDSFRVYKRQKGMLIPNGYIFKRTDKKTDKSFIYVLDKDILKLRLETLKIAIENIKKIDDINCKNLIQLLNEKEQPTNS